MAKNVDVIKAFLVSDGQLKPAVISSSLTTNGIKLFRYSTIIAQWHKGQIYLNLTKYNRATTACQNKIIELIKEGNFKVHGELIVDIKYGTSTLINSENIRYEN